MCYSYVVRTYHVEQSSSICSWMMAHGLIFHFEHSLCTSMPAPNRTELHLCSLGIFINFIRITYAEQAMRLRHEFCIYTKVNSICFCC